MKKCQKIHRGQNCSFIVEIIYIGDPNDVFITFFALNMFRTKIEDYLSVDIMAGFDIVPCVQYIKYILQEFIMGSVLGLSLSTGQRKTGKRALGTPFLVGGKEE